MARDVWVLPGSGSPLWVLLAGGGRGPKRVQPAEHRADATPVPAGRDTQERLAKEAAVERSPRTPRGVPACRTSQHQACTGNNPLVSRIRRHRCRPETGPLRPHSACRGQNFGPRVIHLCQNSQKVRSAVLKLQDARIVWKADRRGQPSPWVLIQ